MLNILFSAEEARWDEYRAPLEAALAERGITAHLSRDHDPATVNYIVFAPNGPVTDFTPFSRCKAAMSLWAGVETVADNPTLSMPLVRMVDPGLTQGMVEWVVAHTLRHHIEMDRHLYGQDGEWRTDYPPLSEDRTVTILGLGALGSACAMALASLGFPVVGWSRQAKSIEGVTCYAGQGQLGTVLKQAQILILLLPLTDDTTELINDQTLAQLPKGAIIINPGRGALIDDDALLSALDSGQIAHATLDTFRTEPLPPDHPYWNDEKVTVTPHIASVTRPDSASRVIADNIARGEDGRPFLNLVDRNAGY